jgi:hypothetical protein
MFHDRGIMEDAVRALVADGVSAQRIRISETADRRGSPPLRTTAERFGFVMVGLAIGTPVGALMALGELYVLGDLGGLPFLMVLLRVSTGALIGAAFGVLSAVILLSAHRGPRLATDVGTNDFLVTVRPSGEANADDVRLCLALYGGQLVGR